MAKLSTVNDSFNDNLLSPLWATYVAGGGTTTEVGQEILLSVQPNTVGSLAELLTVDYYDARDESSYVNFTGAAGSQCDTYFFYLNSSYERFGFLFGSGGLNSYINVGGTETYREYVPLSVGELTYLRIRHSGSTVYWDYSTDGGLGWTTLDSAEQPFSLETIQPLLGVYEWGNSSSPGASHFDNFNYTEQSFVYVSENEQITINESVSIYLETAGTVFVPGIEVIPILESVNAIIEKTPVEISMNVFSTSDNLWYAPDSVFDSHIQTCLNVGITKIRIEIGSYGYAEPLQHSKEAVIRAKSAGVYVLWGVSGDTITASNWPDQRAAVLNAATWAQANGVDEFAIGNEDEYKVDGSTMTVAQIQANLKSLATEVQSIFTRGPVSYNTSKDFLYDWISLGKGNIDTFGLNLYLGGQWGYDDTWMDAIDDAYAAWGSQAYLSEFGPSYTNLADYSTDETAQANGVQEMMDYCSYVGLGPAYYFCFYDDTRPFGPQGFGALKTNGTYRKLWDTLRRFVLLLQASSSSAVTVIENVAVVVTSAGTIVVSPSADLVEVGDAVTVVVSAPSTITLSAFVFDGVYTNEWITAYGSILSISAYSIIYAYEYTLPYIKFTPRRSLKTRRRTRYSGSIKNEFMDGKIKTISKILNYGGKI